MKTIIIIPARYRSSRFPGKPLIEINGKPMIWWTYNQAKKVKHVNDVIVAIDDERVASKCKEFGILYEMTSENCRTSTERAFEVAKKHSADLYIVVNGDEPLIDPNIIGKIIPSDIDKKISVYNLMTPIYDPVQALDPSNIKIVVDVENNALMFSRSLIPYPKSSISYSFYKHIGVLAYNFEALKFFTNTKRGPLEEIEDINELRFLEHGIPIRMIEVDSDSLSVDTEKDLEYVEQVIKGRKL